MEILGRDVDPKMLAIGGVGVAGVMLLMRRNQSDDQGPQTVTLQPGDGLGWDDITGGDPTGRLIGGPGPAGEPGPAGAPGEPGTPGTPGTSAPPPTSVDQDGGGRRRRRRDRDDKGDGGGGRRDRDDRGGGRRDRGDGQIGEPGRPNQGNRQNPPKVDDPRLDDPKRSRRRAEGRGGLRDDRRDDDTRENTDSGGNFDIDVSGGRVRRRGKRANANADGGRANVGNVGPNTTGKVDASGGKAKADASGGNGNRTGQDAKRAAKKLLGKRRGGDAFAGDDPDYQNGHGRRDGRSGAGAGEVNTNPTPGSSVGGFFGLPSPLRGPHDVVVVKEGDTLSGLAQRYYGNANMVQRFYTLNHDVLLGGDKVLRAGTRLKV